MEKISRTPYDLNLLETIWPDIQEGSVERLSQFFKTKKIGYAKNFTGRGDALNF